jgi:hypothetical protein
MPVGRVLAIMDAARAEDKADWQKHVIQAWTLGRVVDAAITSSQDMPQTKADQKKKISDGKITAAKRARIQHDKMWYDALRSPQHTGEWLGMPDILGPPERPPEKSREDRAKEGYEAARRALRNLLGGKRSPE